MIYKLWQGFDPVVAGCVFAAYLLIDGMYAYYTFSVVKRKPFAAANTGFIMHFLLAFGVISYVNNILYVLPLALGSWVGTFVVVFMEKNRKAKSGQAE